MHRLRAVVLMLVMLIALFGTKSAYPQEVKQPQNENYLDRLSSCVALVMGASPDRKPGRFTIALVFTYGMLKIIE